MTEFTDGSTETTVTDTDSTTTKVYEDLDGNMETTITDIDGGVTTSTINVDGTGSTTFPDGSSISYDENAGTTTTT